MARNRDSRVGINTNLFGFAQEAPKAVKEKKPVKEAPKAEKPAKEAQKTVSVKKTDGDEYVLLPMTVIEEDPKNEKIFNMQKIDALAATIDKEGFSGAIEVYEIKSGRYRIISGHRRFRAMQQLGRDEIPAIVSQKKSDTMQRRKLLSSNLQARDKMPMDYARAIAEYEDILREEKFKGDKTAEIAKFCGVAPRQVSRYKELNKFVKDLQDLVEIEGFPYTALVDETPSITTYPKKTQEDIASRIRFIHDQNEELGYSRTMVKRAIAQAVEKYHMEKDGTEAPKAVKQAEKPAAQTPLAARESVSDISPMPKNIFEAQKEDLAQQKTTSITEIRKARDEAVLASVDTDVLYIEDTLERMTKKEINIRDKKRVKEAIKNIRKQLEKIEKNL